VDEYATLDNLKDRKNYVDDISSRLIGEIEEILGYSFREKSVKNQEDENSDDEMLDDSAYSKFYRCSQDKSCASYSKYTPIGSIRKRRRRTVQERYPCAGSIRITIPRSSTGSKIKIPSIGDVNLQNSQIVH